MKTSAPQVFLRSQVLSACTYNLHYSVCYNSLTSTGAIALARALQQNKSLKEFKYVVNVLMFRRELHRYTVGLGCTSFYWISYTRSNYNCMQECNIMYYISVFHFTPRYIHTVLNGMRSCGEILGMREPLHWLIHECSRISKH